MVICTCSVISTRNSSILVHQTEKVFSEGQTLGDACAAYIHHIQDANNYTITELLVKQEETWIDLDHSELASFDIQCVTTEFSQQRLLSLNLRVTPKLHDVGETAKMFLFMPNTI